MGKKATLSLLVVVTTAVAVLVYHRDSILPPSEQRSPPPSVVVEETLSVSDQVGSTVAGESAGDSARFGGDHMDVDRIAEDQVVDELVDRLVSSGGLTASVDGLIEDFESQPNGGATELSRASSLRNEFASQTSLGEYYLDSLECRETLCRGYVVAVDGRTFDYQDLAELSVALLALNSVELEAAHVAGLDKPSVQVFFSKLDDN